MTDYRITKHPILSIEPGEFVSFFWQGQELLAIRGETIASALFANGVHIFGHHDKDGAAQGIFCANGQCAQCLVLVDGRPAKSCMELVQPGMRVEPAEGLPELPAVERITGMESIDEIDVPVLVVGGGPSGLSASIELGKLGIKVLLVDDKHRLGGKLVLQTHRFFGSSNAVYAGTRGIDIATKLEGQLRALDCIDVWLNSTALAVYSDQKVGILREGGQYVLIRPEIILVATGAREKFLAFKGNTLPGVYGAGAFQTLVNRDLIKPAQRLFIVGGGNVGLIAGYHALQAGIQVVGLVEALPECGGYKVHKDKLVRMGVPVYTSHTIVSANGSLQPDDSGDQVVESVTVAQVDDQFRPISGTERTFACDTVLVAVGLVPVDEFYHKALEFGLKAYAAGDAEEIAEASAAMFSGKIKGMEIARALGYDVGEIPPDWYRTAEILKSKPGRTIEAAQSATIQSAALQSASAGGVVPVFHCTQEIPCNPCTTACPHGLIHIDEGDIRLLPSFIGEQVGKSCVGCEKCVTVCPGLAITLVDYRKDLEYAVVTIAYEFLQESIHKGDIVTVLDAEGHALGNVEVASVRAVKAFDRTIAVGVRVPRDFASRVAGIQVQEKQVTRPMDHYVGRITDDTIVCRCERVTAGEIRALIRQGYRDINEIKAVSRAGMGACGAKTCTSLVHRLFRDMGVPADEVVDQTSRPLFVEVPLAFFAGVGGTSSSS